MIHGASKKMVDHLRCMLLMGSHFCTFGIVLVCDMRADLYSFSTCRLDYGLNCHVESMLVDDGLEGGCVVDMVKGGYYDFGLLCTLFD